MRRSRSTRSGRPTKPASSITTCGSRARPATSSAIARSTDSNGFAASGLACSATRRHCARPVEGTCSASRSELTGRDVAVPERRVGDRQRLVEGQVLGAVDHGAPCGGAAVPHLVLGEVAPPDLDPVPAPRLHLPVAGHGDGGRAGRLLRAPSRPAARRSGARRRRTAAQRRDEPVGVRQRVTATRDPDDLAAAERRADPAPDVRWWSRAASRTPPRHTSASTTSTPTTLPRCRGRRSEPSTGRSDVHPGAFDPLGRTEAGGCTSGRSGVSRRGRGRRPGAAAARGRRGRAAAGPRAAAARPTW